MPLLVLLCLALFAVPAVASAADTPAAPTPVDEYIANNTPEWIDRPALTTALNDAGANWTELSKALDAFRPAGAEDSHEGKAYQALLWLVQSAPHLDRLELTAAGLTEDLTLALHAAQERGYDVSGDFFRRYVLNYRFDDEPVTVWRAELARRYAAAGAEGYAPGDPALIARTAVAAQAGFKVVERGYFGNLADPVSVDNARAGTERELSILTAAALRAQGFGVRFVRENRSGKSWVEVYTGPAAKYDETAWTPAYPTDPAQTGYANYARELCGGRIAVVTAGDAFGMEQVTKRYSEVGTVVPKFTRGGEELKDYEHWSICAWDGGRYVPLDDLGYPVSAGDYPLGKPPVTEEGRTAYILGAPGDYQLQAGTRYPGGVVHVVTRDFSLTPGQELPLELALDPPEDLPLAALVERTIGPDGPQEGEYLIAVVDDAEPSVRTLEMLKPLAEQSWHYMVLRRDTQDPAEIKQLETLLIGKDDPLPVVIVLRDGKTLLYLRGYNLNLADWIRRVLQR